MTLTTTELGKHSTYDTTYNPDKLHPIARSDNRVLLGIDPQNLPFFGFDYWNHYEVSWLNEKGKPVVALGTIVYGCDSHNIIESKSMKLYFNSFNNTHFKNAETVAATVQSDLNARLNGGNVSVTITPLTEISQQALLPKLPGIYLDDLDIDCCQYHVDPTLLTTEHTTVTETLYSDLLRSNCLVTNQPDWCGLQITYTGKKINHAGLLRYIVSFRNDNEFHELCIEKIFTHLMRYCQPESLIVYGRSTRRGGLDINSIRATSPIDPKSIVNTRLCRQ